MRPRSRPARPMSMIPLSSRAPASRWTAVAAIERCWRRNRRSREVGNSCRLSGIKCMQVGQSKWLNGAELQGNLMPSRPGSDFPSRPLTSQRHHRNFPLGSGLIFVVGGPNLSHDAPKRRLFLRRRSSGPNWEAVGQVSVTAWAAEPPVAAYTGFYHGPLAYGWPIQIIRV